MSRSLRDVVFASTSSFVLLLLSGTALASETGGEAPMLPEEAIALEAQSYAETYDVSQDQAIRRLALMHDASDAIRDIRAQASGELGGIYFDNGPDFALTVNMTGNTNKVAASFRSKGRNFRDHPVTARGKAFGLTKEKVDRVRDIASKRQNGKVKTVRSAKMRKADIQAVRERVSQRNREIDGFNGSSFDDRTGEMVIRVFSGTNTSKAAADARKLYGDVPFRIEVDDSRPTLNHTRGGATFTGNTGGRCTTGFVVRDRGNNQVGVLTAGHCNWTSARYTAPDGSNYDMVRKKWDMNEKLDLAFFWDDHTPTSEFYPTSSSTPRSLVGWTSVSNLSEEGWFTSGSYICHYGVVSATQSCGEVTDKSYAPSVYDSKGNYIGCGKPGQAIVHCGPYFVRVDKKAKSGQVALQCIGGDSGGPWFAYGNAYGINKGGYRSTSGDKNTCEFAFYTPIVRINDLNLTLWYGGPVSNGIAQ